MSLHSTDHPPSRVLRVKFDRHGLGDCVHFAHALQLYKRRGYDITVQVEENKLFIWKLAGISIVQGGGLPDHPYLYPPGFDDLSLPDHDKNKVMYGLTHDVMPKLEDLGLTASEAWDELCSVRLSAHEHISPEAHAEAEKFLEGLPRPIICFHSRGTNWHERKSIPTEVAFDVILKLLDQTSGSVIVLDYDRRAPMVGDARCKGIKPSWGHISVDRLCALFERSDLVIGIDSGPFHAASLTNVRTLGVFRSLHPVRVCLPNPNAVYLAKDSLSDQWDCRRPQWNIATFRGEEPNADNIVDVAMSMLSGRSTFLSAIETNDALKRLAGRYIYRRIGYDERPMGLDPDGTISEGADGCERRWAVQNVNGAESIVISGKDGVICRCTRTSDGTFRGRWTQFEKMPIDLIPFAVSEVTKSTSAVHIERDYFCEVIGQEEFRIMLLPDGQVTSPNPTFDSWASQAGGLQLRKNSIAVATLQLSDDGCWRGTGTGNSKVELIPARRQPFRSIESVAPIAYRNHEYSYVTLETFKQDCFEFARKLPSVKAIAGVPRSGVIAASLMALELNCPLIPIECLLTGGVPEIPIPRRGRGSRYAADGMILIVDDSSSSSGRVISRLRPQIAPDVKIAVVFGNDQLPQQMRADFIFKPSIRDVHFTFEWALLHDDNAEFTLCDMDGVLCEDWSGADETVGTAYQDFLQNVRPRRIPSYELLGIVTNRLEKHRKATEAWLQRHGIRCQNLIMSPYATVTERDAAADAARRKADAFMRFPTARLFVESCGRQAREIKSLTRRPVLSIEDNCIV